MTGIEVVPWTFSARWAVTLRSWDRFLIPLPFWYGHMIATFLQLLPNKPLTTDQVEMLKSDNIVSSSALTFRDLGVDPQSMDQIVPGYLR